MDRHKWLVTFRFLSGLILLLVVFHGLPAFGEEIPDGQPRVPETVKPAKEAISAQDGYVDRSHAYFDRKINQVIKWFDDLFGDTAVREEKMSDITLQWSNELRLEEGKGLTYQNSFRAHVRLPKFQKKLRLVIMEDKTSIDAESPIRSDPGTPVAYTPTETNNLRAANSELRYYVHETKTGYAFLAAGTRFVWPPETFVRARFLSRRYLVDNTFLTPSVTPFWQDHVGFGITPQLEFGHTFAHDYIFLWANSATVYKNRSGFLWGSEVSLSRILSPVTAVAFAIGATGSTQPSAVTDIYKMGPNNYKISFKYRRRIYRPWLFLELVPETNWRHEDTGSRELIPAFTVRLEMNSEGPRALLPVPQIVKEPLPIPGYEHY